ncbi:MAG: cytidine deaminase [Sphingobacteriales bacterium]|nr:cytidine deaminase [Sphingobacteriales bacterium]
MKEINISLSLQIFDKIGDFNIQEQQLIQAAQVACKNAYAPYSKFQVGCAVLLANGAIVSGNNQENAAYPSGLCAERVTLFYASANYPDVPMLSLAVTVNYEQLHLEDFVFPCGACRQVIAEYEHKSQQPLRIILVGKNEYGVLRSGLDLLPFLFSGDILKKIK